MASKSSLLGTAAAAAILIPVSLHDAGSAVAAIGSGVSHGSGTNSAGSEPSPRIVSGKLPGGKGFKLPPVGQPPFPVPANPRGLPGAKSAPAQLDQPAAYVPQNSCSPGAKKGVTAFKKLVLDRFPGTVDWGSARNCTDDGISEHLDGRAWDWHADANDPKTFAQAASLLTWLTLDDGYWAKRFGIMYIGYNHRIWASYRMGEGWRQLNNSNPHTDHVHFSFSWNGARKSTSFWTGKSYAEDFGPCRIFNNQPAPLRTHRNTVSCDSPQSLPPILKGATLLWRGSGGEKVKVVQQKVGMSIRDGVFGATTAKAVAKYQKAHKLPVTAAVDAQTWFALRMK